MNKSKFNSGELVLVKIPVNEQPKSMVEFGGYWPAKIILKLKKSKRQVKCYASEEKFIVLIEDIIPYNQHNLELYFSKTQLSNNSELALAVEQIESNYVAKHRTAEQLNLSGEGKIFDLLVKNENIPGVNKGESRMMAMWKSHVTRWQDKTAGIGHLSQTVKNFAVKNKDVIVREFYHDFLLHVCTMEQANLISAIHVKQVIDILAGQNQNLITPVHEVEIDDVMMVDIVAEDLSSCDYVEIVDALIDNVIPVLPKNGSGDDTISLLGPGDLRSIAAPNISENCGSSNNIKEVDDSAVIDIIDEEINSNTISDEVLVIEIASDDEDEEAIMQDKEVGNNSKNDDPATENSLGRNDDEIELIEVVGSQTFKDIIFEGGQKRKRRMEMMEDSNKRQIYSKDMVNEHQGEIGNLVNVQEKRGVCRCCKTSIEGYGKATRSTNGNNKTVKISINFEIPTNTFVQMLKDIPQSIAGDASNHQVMDVEMD